MFTNQFFGDIVGLKELKGIIKVSEIRENVKRNMARFLNEKGITQKDFAKKLGVSAPAVSNWLRGLNTPDIEMIAKICGVLDVSVNELFGLTKESLTPFERRLLFQYRNKPELQNAVNVLLGLESESQDAQAVFSSDEYLLYGEAAAYGGDSARIKTTKEKLKKYHQMTDDFDE